MKDIEKIRKDALKQGITFTDVVPSPRSDAKTAEVFRAICKTNKCGNYDRSWTCPPAVGPIDECLEQLYSFDNAVIFMRKFVDVNVKDEASLKKMMKEHQDSCRTIKHMFANEGFDELTLSDGECKFCEKCTYPDKPCRYPNERIPSVSGYGIDMEKYITSNGIEFKFSDNEVTLYGLLLFR